MAMLGAPCDKCCDNCERRGCFWPNPIGIPEKAGDCEEKEGCCCEQDPQGGCFDPSILDEDGNLTVEDEDQFLRGYCFRCCENTVVFSMKAFNEKEPPADPNDRPRSEAAAEWIATVAAWLEANGYVNVSTYNSVCGLGGDGLKTNIVWLRACCNGEYVTEPGTAPPVATEDDCYPTLEAAPDDDVGLAGVLTFSGASGSPCANVDPAGTRIPKCDPNPLP